MSQSIVTYGSYLQLDKLLDAQTLLSAKNSDCVNHELFFIIVHQSNELWFKQILAELTVISDGFCETPAKLSNIHNALARINQIQVLLNQHIVLLETLNPLDFLKFRHLLTPASGFQSLQFRLIEAKLGVYDTKKTDNLGFFMSLNPDERTVFKQYHQQASLFQQIEHWLETYSEPAEQHLNAHYQQLQQKLDNFLNQLKGKRQTPTQSIQLEQLQHYKQAIETVLDKTQYQQIEHRLSYKAFLSALFLYIHQQKPEYAKDFQVIKQLIDYDELLANWRYQHMLMVHRMIGTKVGTGGTQGYSYLQSTVESRRVFKIFSLLSGYLVSDLFLDY